KTGPARKRSGLSIGRLFGGLWNLVVRVFVLAVVVAAGFIGFVWFQHARHSQEIAKALEKGDEATATEDFCRLASYYRWFEYAHSPNPFELRCRQFQMRQGKTFEQTRNPIYPLMVVKSVWGNKQEINMKVGWIKFCLINLDPRPLVVTRRMFLLMGLDNN